MAKLDLYDVTLGDFKTQMQLSEEDAEFYGDNASKVGSVDESAPVAVHHGHVPEDEKKSDEKAAPAPANKSRSASTKS